MSDLEYCVRYLLEEDGREYSSLPADEKQLEDLWRSLVNVRPPMEIHEDYLQHEDAFLQERRKKIPSLDIHLIGEEKVEIWLGDILNLQCGAIVNPANEQGLGCFAPLHNCLDNPMLN